jgi:uncharacterized protein YoxC
VNFNKEKIKQFLPYIVVGLVGGIALYVGNKSSSSGASDSSGVDESTDNYGVVDNENYTNLANNLNNALSSQSANFEKQLEENKKSFLEQLTDLTESNQALQGQLDSKTGQTDSLIKTLTDKISGNEQTISQLTNSLHDVSNQLSALKNQKTLVVKTSSSNYTEPPSPSTIKTGTTGNSSDGKLGAGSGSKTNIPSPVKNDSVIVPTTKIPTSFFIK